MYNALGNSYYVGVFCWRGIEVGGVWCCIRRFAVGGGKGGGGLGWEGFCCGMREAESEYSILEGGYVVRGREGGSVL